MLVETIMFKTLIHCWKDSISLFSKKEFPLFIFSTIQRFKRSFVTYLKYFWWLILLQMLANAFIFEKQGIRFYHPFNLYLDRFLAALPSIFLIVVTVFFMALATRASIEEKNFAYFWSRFTRIHRIFWVFFIIFSVLFPLGLFKIRPFDILIHAINNINHTLEPLLTISISGFFLLYTFPIATLFLLDNKEMSGHPWFAVKDGLIATLFFLPVWLILWGTYALLASIISVIIPSIFFDIPEFLTLFALGFFALCATTNYYLKIKSLNYPLFSR